MELKIEAATAVELRQKIFELAFTMGMPPLTSGAPVALAVVPPQASSGTVTDFTAPASTGQERERRHRRTKEQIIADEKAMKSQGQENGTTAAEASGSQVQGQSQKDATQTAAVGTPGATPTQDDVRAALQEVDKKGGMPAVVAMLEKFGQKRISAIKPEQYTAFIAACKAV